MVSVGETARQQDAHVLTLVPIYYHPHLSTAKVQQPTETVPQPAESMGGFPIATRILALAIRRQPVEIPAHEPARQGAWSLLAGVGPLLLLLWLSLSHLSSSMQMMPPPPSFCHAAAGTETEMEARGCFSLLLET
jgi:hypothetical protein